MKNDPLCPLGVVLCYRPNTTLFCSLFPAHITKDRPADCESDLDSYKHCAGVKLQVLRGNSRRDEGRVMQRERRGEESEKDGERLRKEVLRKRRESET